MTISAQDRLKGLLVIIALASAWASLVSLVMVFTDHSSGSFIGKILTAILLGPVVGGSLALVFHSFLGKALGWLAGLHAIVGLAVLVALKIPYYGLAWPGIKLGELLGIVSFAPVGAAPEIEQQEPRTAPQALGRCPFEGTIYSNEAPPKLLYRIRADWKVDLERQSEWGYVDAKGQIRKAQGPNLRLGGPPLSPYEDGYDPSAPPVIADQGVFARVDGSLCLKGPYGSEIIGQLHAGDGALF